MARKLFLNLLLVGLAIGAGALISFKPWANQKDEANRGVWQQLRVQEARTAKAKADMRAAEKERAELAADRARMESASGKEALARQRGYKKPGEEVLTLDER